MDALAQDWTGEVNWCNPPFAIIDRVLGHMRRGGFRGTILVPQGPLWEAMPWFTEIFYQDPAWLLERRQLEVDENTFLQGGTQTAAPPDWSVWACRVDFSCEGH